MTAAWRASQAHLSLHLSNRHLLLTRATTPYTGHQGWMGIVAGFETYLECFCGWSFLLRCRITVALIQLYNCLKWQAASNTRPKPKAKVPVMSRGCADLQRGLSGYPKSLTSCRKVHFQPRCGTTTATPPSLGICEQHIINCPDDVTHWEQKPDTRILIVHHQLLWHKQVEHFMFLKNV